MRRPDMGDVGGFHRRDTVQDELTWLAIATVMIAAIFESQ